MLKRTKPSARSTVYFADAVGVSLDLIDWHVSTAKAIASRIEQTRTDGGANRSDVVQLLGHLWALIDTTHRLRELVQQAPGIKKKSRHVQLFLRRTSRIDVLRNHVQHLRTEIRSIPTPAPPVWGAVSWVSAQDPHLCFVLFAGTAHPDTSTFSCAYDTWRGEFSQRFIVSISGQTIDIEGIAHAVGEVRPMLDEWLTKGSASARGPFPIVAVRISGTKPPSGRAG
jgi:hypothetical protein